MKFEIEDSGLQSFKEAAESTTKEQYILRIFFAATAVVVAFTILAVVVRM